MSTSYKGWRGSLVLQGTPTKEEAVGSPAEAGQTIFYTNSFPVVDSSGNVTDDETEVSVYVDDVLQQSTAFTLTGSLGKIEFSTAPGAGKVIEITYKYKRTVGYVQNATLTVDGKVDELYEYGSRLPAAIGEGNVTIGLTFERAFVDRDLAGKAIAELEAGTGTLPEFTIYLYPRGNVAGEPYYTLNNCKCNTWRLNAPQNAWVSENGDFVCKSITADTV
ncbi:hypothetical protein KEJ39_03895 [Candidatus Bathyarchaeota archaeon]|nr:hypothetical protein [Candidatus Bathyarchaeota archaeon]